MSSPEHPSLAQVAALFVGIALLSAGARAQIAFENHTKSHQSPQVMEIVAHGDFNNDGREDLMVLALAQRRRGHSIFPAAMARTRRPLRCPRQVFLYAVAVGDFNQDGKLDFAASGPSGSQLSIYLEMETARSRRAKSSVTAQPPEKTFRGSPQQT